MRDPNAVYHAEPDDGRIRARAAAYGASFGTDGPRIPGLGPTAAHDYPLSFELESIGVGAPPMVFESCAVASRRRRLQPFRFLSARRSVST